MPGESSPLSEISTVYTSVGRSRALWDGAEQLARVGTWDWCPETDSVTWSDNMFRLMGYAPGEFAPTPRHVFDRMHPGDVERMQARTAKARQPGVAWASSEYRIVLPDGSIRHMRMTPVAQERSGENGRRQSRVAGFLLDVTDQRCAEREIAVHRAVCRALVGWRSFEIGANLLLRELARALGQSAGVLWTVEQEGLRARVVWSAKIVDRGALRRLLSDVRLAPGVGVSGRAWQLRGPQFASAEDSARAVKGCLNGALDGLQPHVAVPAVYEDEVLAVLTLYSSDPVEPGQRLMNAFAAVAPQIGHLLHTRPDVSAGEALSTRELEVLRLAADGLTRQEVERKLGLSAATVKTHFEHIYRKLGVTNRAAAVSHGLRHGLIA